MPALAHLIASGHIAVFVLALTVLEIGAIAAFGRRGGLTLAASVPNILAGDFLLLAWLFSRTYWLCATACLLGALIAHCVDTAQRWRPPPAQGSGTP